MKAGGVMIAGPRPGQHELAGHLTGNGAMAVRWGGQGWNTQIDQSCWSRLGSVKQGQGADEKVVCTPGDDATGTGGQSREVFSGSFDSSWWFSHHRCSYIISVH